MIKKSVLLTALAIAGFAVTSFAQTVPNYVPSNGLVGWWPFNGNATDESINTNDGTVNGAILTTDRFGNASTAYSFNGTSNFIGTNLFGPTGGSQRTLSFWAKPLNNSGDCSVMGYGTSLPSQMIQPNIAFRNGGEFGIDISDSYQRYYSPNITVGWHFYTVVVPNISSPLTQDILMYMDGVLLSNQATINPTYNINTGSTFPLNFGRNCLGGQYYKGSLDDIGFWNRALTQQEITGLYNGNICYQTITVTDTLLINTNFTGFNPVTYQNTIKIWPNPTNDHITIDNGNLANLTGHQIKISNALGQQVFQSAITQQQFYVDMSTWGGNGIYFVNLINAQGVTIETRKIVLQ
jgi:hypothetical protein